MSNVTLRMIELENYGRFYETASLSFADRLTAVSLKPSEGKTTFVNAIEDLSSIVIEGTVKKQPLNYCRTYINKPKSFVRIDILLDICDASHNGVYRYGIKVSSLGIVSEYLLKESSGRQLFYRYKNDIDFYGLDDETENQIRSVLTSDMPILHLIGSVGAGVQSFFLKFFQRLWIVRAGGLSHRVSASHLFKTSFFSRRSNIEKCCSFLKLLDKNITDMIRVAGTSKVMIVRRNSDGYEYPVELSNESDCLIKYLLLYRAIEALGSYGGTIILDVGSFFATNKLVEYLKTFDLEFVNIIFVTDDRSMESLGIDVAKKSGFE